jgi:hypothetical protein
VLFLATAPRCWHRASTAEADIRKSLGATGKGGNQAAAEVVGKRIAEKAKQLALKKSPSIVLVLLPRSRQNIGRCRTCCWLAVLTQDGNKHGKSSSKNARRQS